jgi:hypothetical protein
MNLKAVTRFSQLFAISQMARQADISWSIQILKHNTALTPAPNARVATSPSPALRFLSSHKHFSG